MMSPSCFRLAPLLALAQATSVDDFHDLFDGKSLDGWVVEGPAKDKSNRTIWSVEDMRIICLGEGFGFLRNDRRELSDFTLRVEYRFTPPPGGKPSGNSGLGIRTRRFDPERSRETRPSYAAFHATPAHASSFTPPAAAPDRSGMTAPRLRV